MRRLLQYVSGASAQTLSIPIFLCPGLFSSRTQSLQGLGTARQRNHRLIYLETTNPSEAPKPSQREIFESLPLVCPGCGAYSQTNGHSDAGFYSATRKSVRAFLAHRTQSLKVKIQGESINGSLAREELAESTTLASENKPKSSDKLHPILLPEKNEDSSKDPSAPPVCDRCHNLRHHNQGKSIDHPTLSAIRRIISESPYKINHVWHVLDAADFPLSLIPKLQRNLTLAPQRSQNRRARHDRYYKGERADISFIITRSDLLAPRKEQVDSMMPYLVGVLRDAMGRDGRGVRLGNVRCVSSHRGWWTPQVKEEVWDRGGGQWMVGKVNVGKSALLENIFPKNRTQDAKTLHDHLKSNKSTSEMRTPGAQEANIARLFENILEEPAEPAIDPDPRGLLPPLPAETSFPVMPSASHLPGTTAGPIRLPFGRGKGELIDLPGLPRGKLDSHVKEEQKSDLVMLSRQKAEQLSVKPGQSLVVSNLLRITPTTPDLVFLACPFVPIDCHVTSTEKAKAIIAQENFSAVKAIANPGVGELVKSAGEFQLDCDVTRARAGPLTRKDAVGMKPDQLHFKVFSTDILVEGVGWIELVAQVRKSALEERVEVEHDSAVREASTKLVYSAKEDSASQIDSVVGVRDEATGSLPFSHKDTQRSPNLVYPTVEIFSPNGKHIGSRKPLGAWMIGGRKKKPKSQRTHRPRRSMKGMKKAMKREIGALREKLGEM